MPIDRNAQAAQDSEQDAEQDAELSQSQGPVGFGINGAPRETQIGGGSPLGPTAEHRATRRPAAPDPADQSASNDSFFDGIGKFFSNLGPQKPAPYDPSKTAAFLDKMGVNPNSPEYRQMQALHQFMSENQAQAPKMSFGDALGQTIGAGFFARAGAHPDAIMANVAQATGQYRAAAIATQQGNQAALQALPGAFFTHISALTAGARQQQLATAMHEQQMYGTHAEIPSQPILFGQGIPPPMASTPASGVVPPAARAPVAPSAPPGAAAAPSTTPMPGVSTTAPMAPASASTDTRSPTPALPATGGGGQMGAANRALERWNAIAESEGWAPESKVRIASAAESLRQSLNRQSLQSMGLTSGGKGAAGGNEQQLQGQQLSALDTFDKHVNDIRAQDPHVVARGLVQKDDIASGEKSYQKLQDQRAASYDNLKNLNDFQSHLDAWQKAGYSTGWSGGDILNLRKMAANFGIGNSESLGHAEAMQKIGTKLATGFVANQPGFSRITQAELAAFQKASPGLELTPAGNRIMLDAMRQQADLSTKIADAADAYKAKRGYLDSGFNSIAADMEHQHAYGQLVHQLSVGAENGSLLPGGAPDRGNRSAGRTAAGPAAPDPATGGYTAAQLATMTMAPAADGSQWVKTQAGWVQQRGGNGTGVAENPRTSGVQTDPVTSQLMRQGARGQDIDDPDVRNATQRTNQAVSAKAGQEMEVARGKARDAHIEGELGKLSGYNLNAWELAHRRQTIAKKYDATNGPPTTTSGSVFDSFSPGY